MQQGQCMAEYTRQQEARASQVPRGLEKGFMTWLASSGIGFRGAKPDAGSDTATPHSHTLSCLAKDAFVIGCAQLHGHAQLHS